MQQESSATGLAEDLGGVDLCIVKFMTNEPFEVGLEKWLRQMIENTDSYLILHFVQNHYHKS
jgi:hypothetical protein